MACGSINVRRSTEESACASGRGAALAGGPQRARAVEALPGRPSKMNMGAAHPNGSGDGGFPGDGGGADLLQHGVSTTLIRRRNARGEDR